MRAKRINEGEIRDVLKPKSKKEITDVINDIKKLVDTDFFTVKDLKDILNKLPDELPVGTCGHYGEFIPMDKYNFSKRSAHPVPNNKSWRFALNINMPVFNISTPYSGEEPY